MEKTYEINHSVVKIKFGDILQSEADVIVSSDDCRLTMGGGISMSIRRAGGEAVERDARKHVPARLGEVVVTSAGNLKQKYVFHAITIDGSQALLAAQPRMVQQLTEIKEFIVNHSVKQCMKCLTALDLTSIAFPAIGTGVAGIPYELAARNMAEALGEVLRHTNRRYEVEIYLLDRYGRMGQWDFLPFFEQFACVEKMARLAENRLKREAVGVNGDGSSFEIPADVAERKGAHEVFISYSRHDLELVKSICSLLHDMNIAYWIDVNGAYSGDNYKQVIVEAIRKASVVVFVSTEHSNASRNVAKEISMADKLGKVVIPVKLDEANFAPQIDYDLNSIDAIDLTDFTAEGMDKLRRTIQGKLAIVRQAAK